MKTLFICHGNVGRSQIAEGYYNHFKNSDDATSAGVDPTTPIKWPVIDSKILLVMKEEGIDLSKKKVKFITEQMVDRAERIFILCKKKDCPVFLLKHKNITFWRIKDPFSASIEECRKIRNIIKKRIGEII